MQSGRSAAICERYKYARWKMSAAANRRRYGRDVASDEASALIQTSLIFRQRLVLRCFSTQDTKWHETVLGSASDLMKHESRRKRVTKLFWSNSKSEWMKAAGSQMKDLGEVLLFHLSET